MEPDEILRIGDEFWTIFEIEDAVYNEIAFTRAIGANPPAPIATLGQTAFIQVQNIEPDQIESAQQGSGLKMIRMDQWHVGINIDRVWVYLELLAGDIKRGVPRQPRPIAGQLQIAYFDYRSSPDIAPKIEFWLFHNQFPAFSMYNANGFAVANALLQFVGRKYTLLECNRETHPEFFRKLRAGLSPAHRRITLRGLNSEFAISPVEVR